jgi:hypothetical protein
MSDTKTNAIGKAVYMEMRRGSQTTQMILMPEVSVANRIVPMSLFRRNITSSSPRRAWRQSSTAYKSTHNEGVFVQLDKELALATFDVRMRDFESVFKQLVSYGYTVYKQPIVVEITEQDAMDASNNKTPYKVLGRITRSRRALDFGESLFA